MPLRRRRLIVLLVVVLALAAFLGVACTGPLPANAPAASQPAEFPLDIDQATYVIVTYQRKGGVAGQDSTAKLFLDGHVELARRNEAPVAFQLSSAEQDQIEAAFEAADFYRNAQQAPTPGPVPADAYQVELTRRGALLQGTLRTHEAEVPPWAKSLIPLLDTLLLSPDPARVAAYQPNVTARGVISPTQATPLPSPDIVLLEFARSGAAGDERLLVNMDRTYSVARNGQVQTGELTEEEMAALLKMLEAANLRERRGDYFPETACESCPGIELIYRNLFGAYKVRSQEGAAPDWLQVISDVLVDSFLSPDQLAARPAASPAAAPITATVAATAAVPTAPAATPASTPGTATAFAATPTPAVVEEPAATATPAPTAAVAEAYGLADLIGDLVTAGARVAPQPGRIVKPYLSAGGVVVTVDGQPVQVFEYDSVSALDDDVDGLAPDASSIDGLPLTWQAPPHFWRRGTVLAVAATDDATLVGQLSQALGQPFAGVP